MIHPADPPPPTVAQLLRELALPLAALALGIVLFIRTAFS
jgi:hypothetical protein